MAGGARRTKKTVDYYSKELPEGVKIVPIFATRSYKMIYEGKALAQRHEEVVLMWKNPEKVFSYIARRAIRERG